MKSKIKQHPPNPLQRGTKSKTLNGFTLLELLVVMTIIGMMMAIGFPLFKSVGKSSRFESAARNIKDRIVLARTKSITQARKFAVRATLTKHKKWKIVIVDSVDNEFDNGNDRIVEDPMFLPKQVVLDEEMEIEFMPGIGGISYATSNPIVITEASDKREIWKIPLTLYKAAGAARIGELEKIFPDKKKSEEESDEILDDDLELERELEREAGNKSE